MFERTKKPSDPVTVYLDGEPLEAEKGEPLAVTLLAASALRLARSPKLHRPRGPSCLRGDCDGCLARVDDVPNVMLCLRRAEGGEKVTTQNVLGSRETDLLRIIDWFFPKGIDHHHLLAGIPGVSEVMQTFARKLAGIGRLPTDAVLARAAERIACDVLVVGAGLAGTVVAAELARAGLDVCVADDGAVTGGSALAAGPEASEILRRCSLDRARLFVESTVVGIYDGEAVVAGRDGAVVTRPKALVLATGAHDGVVVVPNNDLPGVMSARAMAKLGSLGILPTEPVAVVGEGFWVERCLALFGSRVAVVLAESDLAEIEGSSRVKGVKAKGGRRTAVRLVAVATPSAPSFELAEMAGARVQHQSTGYRVVCDERGRATEGTWAVGECTGAAFDPASMASRSEACAADVVSSLRG